MTLKFCILYRFLKIKSKAKGTKKVLWRAEYGKNSLKTIAKCSYRESEIQVDLRSTICLQKSNKPN